MTTTDDLQHHPRLPRVLAAAGAVLSLAGVLLAGAAPAGAQSQAPRCAGEQWLTSISFGPSIQGFFNCDSRIRSFRVHTTAHVVAASSSASVERHGDPKPPPQGFNCRPPRPHAVSCAGLASAGNLVRERFSPETNPCVTATRTTVTVGTGPLDASGEPTGATRTFSLGPLRGCRVAIPAGRRCAGQQVLTETEPEQVVGIIFSCRAPIRSFRFHTSKVNRPALDPFGMVVSTEANVERNGENRPAGFLCTPGNPSAPQSYSCSPFLGGGAAPGDLVRTAFFPRANACDPVQTGVKTGTGPLSPARQPTGTVTVFSLGRLHGCSVALPRRRADSSGGGGSVASGGDANAVVNQRARAG